MGSAGALSIGRGRFDVHADCVVDPGPEGRSILDRSLDTGFSGDNAVTYCPGSTLLWTAYLPHRNIPTGVHALVIIVLVAVSWVSPVQSMPVNRVQMHMLVVSQDDTYIVVVRSVLGPG